MYKQNTELDLRPDTDYRYVISSQHRKIGNPHKSVWTITYEEEVMCFIMSINSNWNDDSISWGIKLSSSSSLHVIGKNTANEELKIAKFVDGSNNDIWHGYPADYKNNVQDIPPSTVLEKWKNNKYINKSHVRKIKQQLLCNL